jgi:hypothetical protein
MCATYSCKEKNNNDNETAGIENETKEIALLKGVNSKLPNDVLQSCVVNPTDFNSWFSSGSVSENGIVNPANSVTFGHLNNCDFYKWSEQMFLWMTSPNTAGDYSNGTLMESSRFYTVSPKVAGERTLIPHEKGALISVISNAQKNDVNVDSEEGQATDDVLMAQNGSLIYYISMVNDVYAQFLTGARNGEIDDSEFPTTQSDVDAIVSYAARQGTRVKDPETLAIEFKTSWVSVNDVVDASQYITIDALVPTYDKTDAKWTPNGSKTAKLAMIGVHVVGSTDGHPEMVWATFEHVNNAPNLAYAYLDTLNRTKTVPEDRGNEWLLNGNSASSEYNKSHMIFSGKGSTKSDSVIAKNSIIAHNGYAISPSDTKLTKPWGVAIDGKPNAENASAAASNSQVISTNNSVLGQLQDGDMRKNYIFIGATWTDNGARPNGKSYSATNTTPGVAIGTSQLANSTMETYIQQGDSYNEDGSCFLCHSNSKSTTGLKPMDLSHIYDAIQPLKTVSN